MKSMKFMACILLLVFTGFPAGAETVKVRVTGAERRPPTGRRRRDGDRRVRIVFYHGSRRGGRVGAGRRRRGARRPHPAERGRGGHRVRRGSHGPAHGGGFLRQKAASCSVRGPVRILLNYIWVSLLTIRLMMKLQFL